MSSAIAFLNNIFRKVVGCILYVGHVLVSAVAFVNFAYAMLYGMTAAGFGIMSAWLKKQADSFLGCDTWNCGISTKFSFSK